MSTPCRAILSAATGSAPVPPRTAPVADLIEAARRVAAEVLAPTAEATDQSESVPAGHLRALAEAGLFSLPHSAGPERDPVADQVYETLASACGVTFFTWVQHHAPVRLFAASPNHALRDRWLPRLRSGEVMGGIAFAHLRRPGPPAIVATKADGGWSITGEAPWVTGWGLAGVFAVAARVEGRVLFVLVVAQANEQVRPSAPLPLIVMRASRTVRLGFDGLFVPDGDVIVDQPFEQWQTRDRITTAQPQPAPFGVAATATRLLGDLAPDEADALDRERDDCRRQIGAAAADPSDLDNLVRLRAWSLDLAIRSAGALVAATGGRAMMIDHPAQRLVREAAFYAIQAQTGALRSALLSRLIR